MEANDCIICPDISTGYNWILPDPQKMESPSKNQLT